MTNRRPSEAQLAIARRLRRQAVACSHLGSPLYAELLEATAGDVEEGGSGWDILRGHEADSPGSALALRLMGAVHRLVLTGQAPQLAAHYPSAGGQADARGAWDAFSAVLATRTDELRPLLQRPVQTNEVRRSRALLGGFLRVAQETGRPLSLLEVGASAGLNLRWDHFRYGIGGHEWGDPASPLCLRDGFRGAHPDLDTDVHVVARRGCDAAPVDPLTPEGRLTLLSYIWADQMERIALLDAAIKVAAEVPATVDRADAPAWLEERLGGEDPGIARVVYHSIVLQYLGDERRRRLEEVIAAAGDRATQSSPLAWLRMEPAGEYADVRLTVWPGGEDRLLAHAGYHGQIVHWLPD